MENYITLSIETHLFFARIMREHALFLEAGFPCKYKEWIEKADYFRCEFENLLKKTVKTGNGLINENVLNSGEIITEYTIAAENKTEELSGIPIDSEISKMEKNLRCISGRNINREHFNAVHRINSEALCLVNGLISYKENLLNEIGNCNIFNANYPLLIKHILREAKLYRATIEELMGNRMPSYKNIKKTEMFWNRIMMEHALFIRGLLDPCEEKLIDTADGFADIFKKLLAEANKQDCCANGQLAGKSLEAAVGIRDFKAAGTEGILDCKISSIILPLLADHVLREANHYIRILHSDMG